MDDEFAYDDILDDDVDDSLQLPTGTTQISNSHHDEAFALSDVSGEDESIRTPPSTVSPRGAGTAGERGHMQRDGGGHGAGPGSRRTAEPVEFDSPPAVPEPSAGEDESDLDASFQPMASQQRSASPGAARRLDDDDVDEEEREAAEEEEESFQHDVHNLEGDAEDDVDYYFKSGYNPDEFASLNSQVSSEVRDIFDYIQRYQPLDVELEVRLAPFLPEYVPSVGEPDPFLKMARPDNAEDGLGLVVVDEPAARQTDPTVLDLQLRVHSTKSNLKPMTVRSIEEAEKNPAKIGTWITNIRDLHAKKPPPTVNYTKTMPEIDDLMQAWPPEFERELERLNRENLNASAAADAPAGSGADEDGLAGLRLAEMDMTLEERVRVICAILDIPVRDNLIEPLHVLFTLYSEFQSNPHFSAV